MAAPGTAQAPQQAVSVSPPKSSDGAPYNELERKRARDRKSQQAMRDRTKYQLQNLTEQVKYLTQVVEEKDANNKRLQVQMESLESELESIKLENGALRLRLIGQPNDRSTDLLPRWQIPPSNTVPTCMSDQIIQDFLASGRSGAGFTPASPGGAERAVYVDKPNFCLLLDRTQRPADAVSRIIGDIVLSYKEIETLPKQVSVFYLMTTLLKWQLLLDEASWDQVPTFLRPTQQQLTIPHPAWIDRIPWPRVRKYLIDHPSITLDAFAMVYSTNFDVSWAYDPKHVVFPAGQSADGLQNIIVNPVFEQHIRDIRNWIVTDAFLTTFPEIGGLIDADTRPV